MTAPNPLSPGFAVDARDLAYRVALARGASPFDADDVAQECAVKALERAASLRDPLRWAGWVAVMAARELAVGHRRASRCRPAGDAVDVARPFDVEPTGVPDAAPGPAVLDLPAAERAAVLAHYFRGLTVAETAAELGVAVGSVKTYLKRGRKRLADAVARGRTLAAVEVNS